MPHNPIKDYKIKVKINIDDAAKAVGLEEELKSLEEPLELYGMDFKANDLYVPKEFDGIAELFPEQLEQAAMWAEESAYGAAWAKEVHGAIESSLEKITDVVCEYLGDTEAGAQESISTEGGIESVRMNNLDDIEIEVKNPHHLINAIVAGVGYFHPPFPVDVEISEKEFKEQLYNLKDYFEVWGERKSEPSSDRLHPISDDEYYKEMIAMSLEEIGDKEAIDALERLAEEEAIDVEEYAKKIEAMTNGSIKADDLIKAVDPQIKMELESKMKIKSKNLYKKESAIQERHGKGLEDVYPDLDKKVKDAVSDAFEKLSNEYDLYANDDAKQIEHKSRDGFISSNDGGYEQSAFTDISQLMGSGYVGNLPEKAQAAIEKSYEDGLEYALEKFKEEYAEEIKDIPADKLNYHDLYKLDKGDLAEKLSNLESDQNSDENSTVMFQLRAMFHNDGPENLSFTIQGAVNWEAPYHRPKGQFEAYYQREIEFTEKEVGSVIAQVKEELANAVKFLGA